MGRITKHIYFCDEPDNDKGQSSVVVHILEGYCPVTMADYKRLLGIVQETFPQATDETQIECSKVIYSDRVKGFTLLIWKGWIDPDTPLNDYEGWEQHEVSERDPEKPDQPVGIQYDYDHT